MLRCGSIYNKIMSGCFYFCW